MSKVEDDIKRGLSALAAQHGPAAIQPATVLALSTSDDTCTVELSDGTVLEDARLRSVVKSGNRWVLVPTVGSVVQVGRIENSDALLVLAVEEVSEVRSKLGTVEWSVTPAGFLLKKGDATLCSLVLELLDAMLAERHTTNYGPTISLTPDSITKYNLLKTKFQSLLRAT